RGHRSHMGRLREVARAHDRVADDDRRPRRRAGARRDRLRIARRIHVARRYPDRGAAARRARHARHGQRPHPRQAAREGVRRGGRRRRIAIWARGMQQRILGRTGRSVSTIGLGTWRLGADWGDVSEADARAVLDASLASGVTFFDTADVYGDGRSESIIGAWRRDNVGVDITVATKMGRRLPQVPENYVMDNFRAWTDRSRRNLGVDTLDLVQLH